MTKSPKNTAASVRARLLQLAHDRGQEYQLVLTRYANERFLYRLSQSSHGSNFVLKGAALFTLWTGEPHRTTRDVDLLGFGDSSEAHIRAVFEDILSTNVEEDGVRFDQDSLAVDPIRAQQTYAGVRVVLDAHITSAKVRLQIDVGFGDAVTPEAVAVDFPTLLDFPAPHLQAYPKETVVAEKLEAMIQLGLANSRMKDFFDLVIISRTFAFDGELLVQAIRKTFERRETPLPHIRPLALTSDFAEDRDKKVQWDAFLRKSDAPNIGDLPSVLASLTIFVEGPLQSAAASETFTKQWPLGGPWS